MDPLELKDKLEKVHLIHFPQHRTHVNTLCFGWQSTAAIDRLLSPGSPEEH